jgi:hypothetical protein
LTIQEILNYVDRKFPNQESTANKVIDLNKIYTEVFVKLKRLSNTYSLDATDVTVADQEEYDLPTGVKIEDILKLEVETADGSDEYDVFEYAGLNDSIRNKQVFMKGSAETKYYLYDDELALTSADRTIRIYYNVRPITFSAGTLTAVPNIDLEYHSLLCYALIVELASQGNNPYRDVANYYQQKYDEFMFEVMKDIEDRATSNGRLYIKEQKERW